MSKIQSKTSTTKQPTQLNFEEQLEKVGGFGLYQKVFMGVSASVLTVCLVMNLSTVFTLEERTFYCFQNSTISENPQMNQCNCPGKIEFSPEDEPSAVTKYGLICENEKHRHWARFAWAFGLLCGSPVNGYLADRFGRRSQILLCSLIVLIFGILGPVMPNYLLYSVFRFITSIGCSGYIIVSFVYLAETMNNRGRGYLGVFLITAWSTGGSAVAFFGNFFRNFLVYDWASAILFATLGIIITVCAVESPRWRYTQSDEWRYFRDMLFIARINGRKLTEEDKKSISICKEAKQSQIIKLQKLESADLSSSSDESEQTIVSGMRDLFVNKYTAVTTLLIWYIWIAVSFTCYSMVFHALIGDKVLNFFIGSIIEVSMDMGMLAVIQRTRRKLLLLFFMSLAAGGSISATLLNFLNLQHEYHTLYVVLTLSCRMLSGVFWGVLGLVTTETYPTVLRAQANGVANLMARISICLVTVMGMVPQKPMLATVAVAQILIIISVTMLPETQNKDLPTNLEEYATFCKNESLKIIKRRKKHDNEKQYKLGENNGIKVEL